MAERYYLHPDELDPVRTCQSKCFITRVMFIAVVARPRFDNEGNVVFSVKIGIFPFVVKEPAKRSSRNYPFGTMETKPLAITKHVYRVWLIKKILPAIRDKWLRSRGVKTVIIQHDNARLHIGPADPEFLASASQDELNFELLFQPPNSSDMNVLNLGFFRAIQSLQHQHAPNTIDELLGAVSKAFDELSSYTLDYH